MTFKNEDGVALVMVLLLLTIGGILVPVFMNASRTHIETAKYKEATSKSFYFADSGVEFVKANINDIDFGEIAIDKYLDINNLKFEDNDNWFGKGDFDFGDKEVQEIQFRIKVIDENPVTLISKGKFYSGDNEYIEEIQFELQGTNNFNINRRNPEDKPHYTISGDDDIEDHIGIWSWEDSFEAGASKFLSSDLSDESGHFIRENFDIRTNTITSDKKNVSILSNDNLDIEKGVTIDNSIVVVEGHIDAVKDKIKNLQIINSVIIIKDYADFRGAMKNWTNPLFLIYANKEKSNKGYFNISGGGNFDINIEELPEKYNISDIMNWQQK